jgi:riboflavin synthase
MFSGIVNGIVAVSNISKKEHFQTFSLAIPNNLREKLEIGASIAVDGVCMTTTKIEGNNVFFDAMKETLARTTLGQLNPGDWVNIERSIKYGDEVGGHQVSGHVHGKTNIITIDKSHEDNCMMVFRVPQALMKYLFYKGFVSLNGTSLTVAEVNKIQNTISIYFIPETLQKTTYGTKKIGDEVNIEIDTQTQSIVDTVERYLEERNGQINAGVNQ